MVLIVCDTLSVPTEQDSACTCCAVSLAGNIQRSRQTGVWSHEAVKTVQLHRYHLLAASESTSTSECELVANCSLSKQLLNLVDRPNQGDALRGLLASHCMKAVHAALQHESFWNVSKYSR